MDRSTLRTHIIVGTFVICLALAPLASADIAVKFFGTAQANELSPDIEQAVVESGVSVDGFNCFQAPLFDLGSGRQIGIGVDCLNPFDTLGDVAGEGLQIEAKTFFFLRNGVLVNHGCTSARPFFAGVGDAGVTHMTGSIPAGEFGAGDSPSSSCDSAGGLIHTSGRYENVTGEARLSGAVNLSNAAVGEITFSCMFVLDLHRSEGPGDDDEEARATQRRIRQ
jgi:hypothetical protein